MKTEFEETEYKGNRLFSIFELDEAGERKGEYPVISFGIKKARAIINHADDLLEWVETYENPSCDTVWKD